MLPFLSLLGEERLLPFFQQNTSPERISLALCNLQPSKELQSRSPSSKKLLQSQPLAVLRAIQAGTEQRLDLQGPETPA